MQGYGSPDTFIQKQDNTMTDETEKINVYGARVHNLKDIDVEIPRNSLTVITAWSVPMWIRLRD